LKKRRPVVKTDAEFITALHQSQDAVDKVAGFLKGRGAEVSVPELKVRPDFTQRFAYQDDGDIHITQRVEVKRKQLDFTCADDFPFATVMTDAAYKINSIPWGHLHSYFVLNRAMTHAALVLNHTRPQWVEETVYDSKERERRTYLACPKELAHFFPLES
jgi:hypothetical protein